MGLAAKVKRMTRRAGIEVTRHPAPNTLPWQLQQVIKLRRVDGVVDVGAHWGEFATMVRRVVGFSGPIESFEPSSESFAILQTYMAGDTSWWGHRVAIGAEEARLDLNIYGSTDMNSFRGPAKTGGLGEARTESVDVHRLDDVVTLPGSLLLKTDTQGFDLEVLQGASGLLHRTVAVTIELPVTNIYADAPELVGITQYLSADGFELAGLFPLVRNRADRLRVVEFDGVFVRR